MVHASFVTRLPMALKAVGVVAVLGGALALAPPAGAVIPPSSARARRNGWRRFGTSSPARSSTGSTWS